MNEPKPTIIDFLETYSWVIIVVMLLISAIVLHIINDNTYDSIDEVYKLT
jgi:hypothetical protein